MKTRRPMARDEARKALEESKQMMARELSRAQAELVTCEPEERKTWESVERLARKALVGLVNETPESYAAKLEQQARSREQFREAQREVKEWRDAYKRCKARRDPEPPHPRYQKQAWLQWKWDEYHVRPFRPQ